MEALAHAMQDKHFPASLELVLSSNPNAPGIAKAQKLGLSVEIINCKEFSKSIQEHLNAKKIELICLAGFMHILDPKFVRDWQGKILNIHPSLLPAYPGLNTHARVLADQQKQTGCTVHFVTEKIDQGPIIAQQAVPVYSNDSPESLASRVLEAEHQLYPEALKKELEQPFI